MFRSSAFHGGIKRPLGPLRRRLAGKQVKATSIDHPVHTGAASTRRRGAGWPPKRTQSRPSNRPLPNRTWVQGGAHSPTVERQAPQCRLLRDRHSLCAPHAAQPGQNAAQAATQRHGEKSVPAVCDGGNGVRTHCLLLVELGPPLPSSSYDSSPLLLNDTSRKRLDMMPVPEQLNNWPTR